MTPNTLHSQDALDKARHDAEDRRHELRTVRQSLAMINRLSWGAIGAGSLIPLAGVTAFATDKGVPAAVAWMIDPFSVAILAAAVLATGTLSRYGHKLGFWLRLTPWAASLTTLALNTWKPLHLDTTGTPDWGGVLAHGAPSCLVILGVEGAVHAARTYSLIISDLEKALLNAERRVSDEQRTADTLAQEEQKARDLAADMEKEERQAQERQRQEQERHLAEERQAAARAHELELARIAARTAPASPRPVAAPGRSRLTPEEISAIEEQLADEIEATEGWEPNYDDLKARYSKEQRWCEARVSAARAILANRPQRTLHAVTEQAVS